MITASIVLYNTKIDDLKTVIKSYNPSANRLLYLIDNSEERPEYISVLVNDCVKYIRNEKNLGYGAGHNIGIKKAFEKGADYHVILNPDISFDSAAIDKIVKYADADRDIAYIMPKVVNPSGEIQYLCKLLPTPFDLIFRRFFPNVGLIRKVNERYILKNFDYNSIINPPCLSGCFMFLRTKTLQENDLLFDERFFMYCEDFDLIRRIHRISKTIYYPEVTIVHNHARESYKSRKMLLLHIKSAIKYFNKYGWIFDRERKRMNADAISQID